jgi:hypothetical protein
MVVIMFVGRNSWTKQSEQEQCYNGETKSWIPLCRPFSWTLSHRYQRCQGINVGIHFVLEQIRNTQFCRCKTTAAATSEAIKMMGLLFTFVQTCLAYFSHGDECLLHSWRLLTWFLRHTPEHMSHHLWSSSNVMDLYKDSIDSPGICWHDSPSTLHWAGAAKLVANLTCVQSVIWNVPSEIPNM